MSSAVLINSCDKYSLAWSIFSWAFETYWKDCPFKIYFITNFLDAPLGSTIKVGSLNWSEGTKVALEQIKEDYIIWFQEDFWLTNDTQTKDLIRLCSKMKKNNVKHLRLYVSEKSKAVKRQALDDELDILNTNEYFRCAFNVGIWERTALLNLLDEKENIWKAEYGITDRSRDLLFCAVKEMKYIKYDITKNMCTKGQFTNDALDYLRNQPVTLLRWKENVYD